jgi:hypothetical protein
MKGKTEEKSGKALSSFPFAFLIFVTLDIERITMEK